MNEIILPLSIIIPTLNRPVSLERTLSTIFHFQYWPQQIVVVDQSEDVNIQLINKDKLDSLAVKTTYIRQKDPSSTAARNIGLSVADNDLIIFMDDDVDVNENTLANIYERMRDESISMIGVLDELSSGSKYGSIGYFFGMKSYKNRKIGHVTNAMVGKYPDRINGEVNTMWAMGYCFAVRKSLILKWGLVFDEQLKGYAYAEDLDFSYSYYKKSIESNKRCILSEKISVKHLASNEYRVTTKNNIYKYIINRTYLAYKHKMGIKGQAMILWNNIGFFIVMALNRTNPLYVIRCQVACEKVRKMLKKGILPNDPVT